MTGTFEEIAMMGLISLMVSFLLLLVIAAFTSMD